MKLPSFRRLNTTDYPAEYKDLIDTLSVSINYGFEVIYSVLNGKATISDNTASFIKEVEVEVDSTGKPKTKAGFKLEGTGRIEGLQVIRVDNLTNSTIYPTSGVLISFTETTTDITFNNITGLPANNTFKLKIMAIR